MRTWIRHCRLLVAVGALGVAGAASAAGVSSDFASDADGWTAVVLGNGSNDAPLFGQAPLGSATVVHNAAGNISVTDPDGNWTYFVAPTKYLGNQSAVFGGTLSFDSTQQSNGGAIINAPNVALRSGGTVLVYGSNNPPSEFPQWKHFVVPFATDAAGWHVGSLDGAAATGDQLMLALGDLSALLISGEFITPIVETTFLDNVQVAPVPLPPAIVGFAAALGLIRARRRA